MIFCFSLELRKFEIKALLTFKYITLGYLNFFGIEHAKVAYIGLSALHWFLLLIYFSYRWH